MRIGILGGSFDPVHYGHLHLGKNALDRMLLDRILFLPVGKTPHKAKQLKASAQARLEMLRLAIRSYPEFDICEIEINSKLIAYTADTLRFLHGTRPEDELFFIVGSDVFSSIHYWWHAEEICKLTSFIIAQRPDTPTPDFSNFQAIASEEKIEYWKKQIIPMREIDISSTSIRTKMSKGESIRSMTPDSVVEYIRSNRLYQ